jgi:hypothetical protein
MSEKVPTKAERNAAVAAVLAEGVRENKIPWTEAARLIRADLRRLQTNKKQSIPVRSVAAQQVIKEAERLGETPPKNGSADALHADHVFPLTEFDIKGTITPHDWLTLLTERGQVVCVTAKENYELEQVERSGVNGWAKYEAAGIQLVDSVTGQPIAPTTGAAHS